MTVCFDADLVQRYGGRGPRYTSYPTALQFGDTVTESQYRSNAEATNDGKIPLSLYTHIPFCHSLCYYCGCNKVVTRNRARVEQYMRMLFREVEMQAQLFDRSRKVEQLHFGGGTPTYLSGDQLNELMTRLRTAFDFDDSGNHEFSIEVDPRTIDEESIYRLNELGFNRLSLGIQDFDPAVQNAVNRIQSTEDVQTLVAAARGTGFKSISFDLIYGLPHQTVASFDSTLERVIGMRPDRVAVYNYAHLPQRFKGQRMINSTDIPSPQEKLEIFRHTIETLCGYGYEYIGMDHFALPDDELVIAKAERTLQRNFQGYSTHGHCDLIALGVSAIGSIGNIFSQNAVSTADYEAYLEMGRLPITKGIIVDDDDLLRADVIQTLMCYDELSFDDFNRKYDLDFPAYFSSELQKLQVLAADDLVELDKTGIAISDKGRLLLRSIAMVFDRYIDQAQSDDRFSKAI